MARSFASILLLALIASTSTVAGFTRPHVTPAAEPTLVKSSSTDARRRDAIATGYGTGILKSRDANSNSGALFSKKKKKAAASSGKIQVKMLKRVEGTGNPGDVVRVAPAFFNNKLKPSGAAEIITDDAVAAERKAKEEKHREVLDAAKAMQEKITDMEIECSMKAGPEGHLFGSVGHKNILDELRGKFPKGALGKKVKIVAIKDGDDKEVAHGDIKDVGTFTARIQLLKDVEAKFSVNVKEA